VGAATCRCWWAARCCTSRPCSTAWTRCRPPIARCILRALEVHRVSGQPLSSFHSPKPVRPHPPLIALEPDARSWLHARIETRFGQILAEGLVDEVRGLRSRGDLHTELPSMRCVGYRQTWEALVADDLSDLPERGVAATRQLAKRQLTWLRSMPQRHRVACDAPGAIDAVVALASQLADALPTA
jgi:tRNA dimethylallyltransferase